MSLVYEDRGSESPYVEKVGHFYAEQAAGQVCAAHTTWSILLVKHQGETALTVWGPETHAADMRYPKDAEFMFIHLKLGAFMPGFPMPTLVNTGVILPGAAGQKAWLDSRAWQFPTYDNADTFVEWLVRDGLLMYEPLVDAVIHDQPQTDLAPRTVRHRFLRATGITPSVVRQLERAQHAATLLSQGVSILDVVDQAGYADQPHLTRALRRFIGQTPGELVR
jgi:hypothetical protein